ncbi:MAG: hypothetical protein V5A68_02185 [Candidatus Thermoplasmatota archaeon]
MRRLFIKALIKKYNMERKDAEKLADKVEKIFAGKKEIEDMSMDKYSRALFYELQNQNLLKLRREELKDDGRTLRKYYWSFDNKSIKKEAHRKKGKDKYKIYKKIPTSIWLKHQTNFNLKN